MKNSLLILFLLSSISLADDYVCTTKYQANIRKEQTSNSKLIKKLDRYTPLNVIKTEGNWLNVKGYNFEGWILNTLVSNEIKCMQILKPNYAKCSRKPFKRKNRLEYLESFKIEKIEIGCNQVKDSSNRKLWLSNFYIWPADGTSNQIIIN